MALPAAPEPDTSESNCFVCGAPGEVIVCDVKGCDKVRAARSTVCVARVP